MVRTTIPKALANAEAVVDMVIESDEFPLLLNTNCCWAKAEVFVVDLNHNYFIFINMYRSDKICRLSYSLYIYHLKEK